MENVLVYISNMGQVVMRTFTNFYEVLQFSFWLPGFGDITVLEVMFGVGLPTFITCTIIKWLIGIVT